MVAHIIEYLDEMIAAQSVPTGMNTSGDNLGTQFETLKSLLAEIDASSVLAADKAEFSTLKGETERRVARTMPRKSPEEVVFLKRIRALLTRIVAVNHSTTMSRFRFVIDPELREIIARDYAELSSKLVPASAWKSVVVMAGSILEAILLDQLQKDAKCIAAVESFFRKTLATSANKIKEFRSQDSKLSDLIAAAVDVQVLPSDRAPTIDSVLREFRNFIHPAREIRSARSIGEAEALLARGALAVVCKHFNPAFGEN